VYDQAWWDIVGCILGTMGRHLIEQDARGLADDARRLSEITQELGRMPTMTSPHSDPQTLVDVLSFEKGWEQPLVDLLTHLVVEVGELCDAYLSTYTKHPRRVGRERGDVADELGDVAFLVLRICNETGYSFDKLVEDTANKVRERKYE